MALWPEHREAIPVHVTTPGEVRIRLPDRAAKQQRLGESAPNRDQSSTTRTAYGVNFTVSTSPSVIA